jgi:hypothetical protein
MTVVRKGFQTVDRSETHSVGQMVNWMAAPLVATMAVLWGKKKADCLDAPMAASLDWMKVGRRACQRAARLDSLTADQWAFWKVALLESWKVVRLVLWKVDLRVK